MFLLKSNLISSRGMINDSFDIMNTRISLFWNGNFITGKSGQSGCLLNLAYCGTLNKIVHQPKYMLLTRKFEKKLVK